MKLELLIKFVEGVVIITALQSATAFETPIASNVRGVSRGGVLGLNRHRSVKHAEPQAPALSMKKSSSASPSQIESIITNAKTLNPFNRQKSGKEVQGVILPSLAAGLAVSLAMIPEAVSFAYVA